MVLLLCVQYIEGRGKLVDANTVEVAGKRYTVRQGFTVCLGSSDIMGA